MAVLTQDSSWGRGGGGNWKGNFILAKFSYGKNLQHCTCKHKHMEIEITASEKRRNCSPILVPV